MKPIHLNNIPRPTDKVIGRGDQLAVIREQLAEDNALTLMNGIGGGGGFFGEPGEGEKK